MRNRGRGRLRLRRLLIPPLAVLAGACGDPVERSIARIVEGGEGVEEARLELNMAKARAVEPLVRALDDRNLPVRARIDFVQALYRLHLREEQPAILPALLRAVADPEPGVRAAAARALGNLRRAESVDPLLHRLSVEEDPVMQGEILQALELMCLDDNRIDLSLFSGAQVDSLTGRLVRMGAVERPDSLDRERREWLEVVADHMAVEARKLYLAADAAGAESLLREALDLVPGSLNIGQKLGRLYYEMGERRRGLEHLAALGMVAAARPLPSPPAIDGRLDDPAWGAVEPIEEFYQCIHRLAPHPARGRAEARLGYHGQTLYFAVKGYEEDTAGLVADATQRDSREIYRDDCIEIFLDTNHDSRSFFQFIINSLGTVADDADGAYGEGRSWSTRVEIATFVADTFWVAEVALPAAGLKGAAFAPGDVWGFNICRVRTGNASEYAQWVPTYGYAERPDRFGYLLFE